MLINGREKNYYPQTSFLAEEEPEPKDSDGYETYVGHNGKTYLDVPSSGKSTRGLIGEKRAQEYLIMRGADAPQCNNNSQADLTVTLEQGRGVHLNVQVKTLSPYTQDGRKGRVTVTRQVYIKKEDAEDKHMSGVKEVPYDDTLVHVIAVVNGDYIWTIPIGYLNGASRITTHHYNRWRHSLVEAKKEFDLGTLKILRAVEDFEGGTCL